MATQEGTKIHCAILDAMADIDAITKDKKNAQQGFNFRGIDDVYNRLHPILAKHRVYTIPEVIAERSEERKTKSGGALIYRILTIRYTFATDDGSSVSVVVIGEGMDSGDKASNKAMAVAHKYALLQVFAIPTEDMADPDAETQPEIEPKPSKAAPSDELASAAGDFKAALDELDKVAPAEAVDDWRKRGTVAFKDSDYLLLSSMAHKIRSGLQTDKCENDKGLF